ncbi:uncharacterized protein F5147DRAFT_575608 [Suillus discolor]|uniref:ABM domain-containing protein n=1 Tax=Suillus discolor TaxID=1912936 RepID=A0A9P7F942_9AGAM|nr:uncharacterized protein F5147DRAFT_575608 [Suillus discolor]KAG2109590.1 hypothetical protein F5147DRAFT_575608 [Suillus discolor]
MAIPTTELVIFDTTEEVRNDRSILSPAFEIVSKSDGIQMPAYVGTQIENPARGYVFMNWDSLAHHQAMLESPSYATLLEALKPAYGGWSKMYHVIFNAHPIAFQQPVTEVLLLTVENADHRTEVFDILTKISDSTEKMLVFGPALEDENVIIVVGGWQSVEAHWEMVANPEPKAALEQLYTLANKDHLFHSTLTSFHGEVAVVC